MPKIDTGATASYNGLILSVQRRAARGVTVSCELHLVPLHQRSRRKQRWSSADPTMTARPIRTTGTLTAATARSGNRPPACFQRVGRRFHAAVLQRNAACTGFRLEILADIQSPLGRLYVHYHQSGPSVEHDSQPARQSVAKIPTETNPSATISVPQHSRCPRWARSETGLRAALPDRARGNST